MRAYEAILDALRSRQSMVGTKDERMVFADARYAALPFDKQYFHAIVPDKHGTLCFVDGGNMEILGSSSFSLQLIRVAAITFCDGAPASRTIEEFFSYTQTQILDGDIFYETRIFGSSLIAPFRLHSMDETLKEGLFRFRVQRAGECARKYAELAMAAKACASLPAQSVLVLDGTLQEAVTGEHPYREAAYAAARAARVHVCALAKTNTLVTSAGRSINAALASMVTTSDAQPALQRWAYHPICAISHPTHPAALLFVKLNPHTHHSFRFEVHQSCADEWERIARMLAAVSDDFSFPGYPYGLIEADAAARVTQQETASLKAQMQLMLGTDGETLSGEMATQDAHRVLDHLKH